ncbi:hypothetical protein P5G50_17215 [Leifsonia sp. F6_8S_P_1B]|uniref:CDP-Glycerol:Poly(Glycerophosphate) glycerophosphotransferase n=1 Tax=Leifsonia williamsii TaxID=3035919 RepID=A0ABT8KFG4_9MICO|nr:DUF6716 putative glycosyltransferase [Leifsonia williamsii]MDN4616191.1 hypothetical protein [Leifsonia williamsii]
MPRRLLGIVDTDSFAKWGAHLLSAAPSEWTLELATVATPTAASAAQLRAALHGVDERLAHAAAHPPAAEHVDAIVDRIRRDPPDAVVVATIGPVAELIIDLLHRRVRPRPVIVTGLPGISYPAKWKGIFLRARADVFVLHSRREVREYARLAAEGGVEPHFALATLPFLRRGSGDGSSSASRPAADEVRDGVIFAAQPSVPAAEEDRRRIVHWLAETALAHPEWRVVLKTRALRGEQQTHREAHPYADLLPADAPANLTVETGPMSAHLDRAVALVTVSSTAVVEAIDRRLPALTLTDFGVSRSLINEVFVGSGLEGTSADLVAGRFGSAGEEWRADNYFHPASADDWAARTLTLMEARDRGLLRDRPSVRRSRGGALRRAWERKIALGPFDRSALGAVALVIGTPIRRVRRLARRWRPTPPVTPA